MSLLSLIFDTAISAGLSSFGRRTQIGFASVDVAISVEHDRSADVTEFPVEFGATITDHVRLRPRTLVISGFVTDTPLDSSGLSLGAVRSSATFHLLQAMYEARVPLIVLTPRQLYTDMIIERLHVPESKEGALRFECTLRHIVRVFSQNAALPATAEVAPDQAAATSGGGTGRLTAGNVANPEHAAGTVGVRSATQPAPARSSSWLSTLSGIGA